MPNCERIHETVVKDIVDIITDIKDTDEVDYFKLKKNNLNYSSIASGSSNLTLVFPVIVSRNMEISTAAMISKAIERKCVTMLQMLFNAICVSDKENLVDYVQQFHTNIKIKDGMDVDEFIDIMDKIAADESAMIKITDKELYEAAKADLKNLCHVLPENINESSLNDFKVLGSGLLGGKEVVQEAPSFNPRIFDRNTVQTAKSVIDMSKSEEDFFRNQIIDSDIKKANELIPTMMVVNFVSKQKDGEAIAISNAVIGVKAKMYAVESMDIINRIITKNKDRNGLFNFIRATTREISFFRDFLFAIDKAKLDAVSSVSGESSKLWKVLERRSVKSKIRRSIGRTANDASAISTLVLSQNEIEYLKTNESINMTNPATARGIMESYNLMAVVIADEASETADFLFDTGDDIFETLSFNHLEREASDGSYKKVINLMTKMTR